MVKTPEFDEVAVAHEKVLVALLNLMKDGRATPPDRVALYV
jgi:ATP-dependent Clp protease ATP-binding subunit ClpA